MTNVDYHSSGYGDSYRKYNDYVELYGGNYTACSDYAENNLPYSEYHSEYLRDDDAVWSNYHETHLYKLEATEVWTDAEQSDTDWRADDDETWFEYKGENYDKEVDEDDLKDDKE